ncbi:hypothetical protein PV433_05090 [Paenibacillus sp. GYB004]|uniref:hypothetical protein n=1 Tax=Paenibacillus sp. GYB004 TaxID=2994393 RepID=UPI002F962E9F
MERLPSKTSLTFEPRLESVPSHVTAAIAVLGQKLAGCEAAWLVGGSCGALLQGVLLDAIPRDLDVYADAGFAVELHGRLADLATDEQAYSETGMYGSMLSHYSIKGLQAELVCSLTVHKDDAEYTVQVEELLADYAWAGRIGGVPVKFMPLAHELLFNVLRNRADRYEPIADAMREQPEAHLPLLAVMLGRNRIGPAYTELIRNLLQLPADWEVRTP